MLNQPLSDHNLLAAYDRASQYFKGLMAIDKLAINTSLVPHWIGETGCFWYRRKTWQGTNFRLVYASSSKHIEAFDHQILAAALSETTGETVEAINLPLEKVEISLSPLQIKFVAFDQSYSFDPESDTLIELNTSGLLAEAKASDNKLVSPNGQYAAFVKDHNLWLQNLATGEQHALTRDGEPHYPYATSPVALGVAANGDVQAQWSPDSKQLLTVQTDRRQVKTTPILHHIPSDGSLRPQVEEQRCAYPGDDHVEELRLLTIDCETGKQQDANYGRIPVKRFGHGLFSDKLAWWSLDNRLAYFVDLSRNGQKARVVELDTHSGNTRILFEETSATFIQLASNEMTNASLRPLPTTNELIWYSERSGWAHLYLYDLSTGELKHPITEGEWLVRDLLHIDTEKRELWIQTAGRDTSIDPYYRDICRVNIDTGELTTVASGDKEFTVLAPGNIDYFWRNLFDPEVNDHTSGISPQGEFVVTCQSRIDQAPVTQLLDRNGEVVLTLEEADLAGFPAGWQWPEPVKLTAADNATAIYGAVFKPSDFSPDKHYPVIDASLYSPEMCMTPKGFLGNDTTCGVFFLHCMALAELGFIVVLLDGRGSAYRSKAFKDNSYGSLAAVNNTDDRIAGIQQLAAQRPYMDVTRVGLMDFGSDGGTLFRHADFYQASVCFGVMDSRLMGAALWGDHYEGEAPTAARAEQLAHQLKGKLLLIHGFLDPIVPVAGTLRIVDALQKANKDFDLLLMPADGHGLDTHPYTCRRAWDYLVKHLQGVEPPKEFQLAQP